VGFARVIKSLPFDWLILTMGSKPGIKSTTSRTTGGTKEFWPIRMERMRVLFG
jgi:hypothetical protein